MELVSHMPALILDSLLFTLLSLVLAFLVDLIIPSPKPDENILLTIFWLVIQIILDTVIIFLLSYAYGEVVKREPDKYYGLTMFIVIFFIAQGQLYVRLKTVYKKFIGFNIDFE